MHAQIQLAKPVSLLELMEDYRVADFALMLGSIVGITRDLALADHLSKMTADSEYFSSLGKVLEGLRITCANFEADPSLLSLMDELSESLMAGTADQRASVLNAQLEMIVKGIQENLSRCKFMFMPAHTATYWEKYDLFGKNFAIVFPEAAGLEMIEAGCCFAARRGTACVFHCMRVTEYGLRMLAEILQVELTDKGQPQPIASAAWDKVIQAIKNKIASTRQLSNGPIKEADLKFYSNMADQCEYMKDMWRNDVSHTRRLYSYAETLGVLGRVKEFCEALISHRLPYAMKQYRANQAFPN